MRTCSTCRVSKPKAEFVRHAGKPGGRDTRCKSCKSGAQRLARFGITVEQYQAVLDAQGGVCAICARPETSTYRGRPRLLAVDHDHATGRIRGLLCARCNHLLGNSGDDPIVLLAAARYLTTTPDFVAALPLAQGRMDWVST